MSCGNPEAGDENGQEEVALMSKRKPLPEKGSRVCQRCRESKSKFVVRSAPLCTTCFKLNVRSRFNRQLFPSLRPDEINSKIASRREAFRPSKQTGNALVALSGGAGSMGMLELLMQGNCIGNGDGKKADITKGEREVIWDRGTVIYVDFSGVVDDLDDRTAWLRAIAEQRGLGFVGLRAEDVYVAGLAERLGGSKVETSLMEVDLRSRDLPLRASSSSDAPLESLRKLVSSLPAASRPVLFSNILTSLLHIAARCIPNISHLLLGETSTRQAQRIISGTALGRGWSLPLELASDLNLNGIMRLQPMKDLTVKDATYFCWLNRLDSRNYRSWSARGGSTGSRGKGATSLEGLTEHFIAGLSVTHPSTISTITKTGDKLMFTGLIGNHKLCPLCQLPVENGALEWKSRSALTALEVTAGRSKPQRPAESRSLQLAPLLCYACLTTMTVTVTSTGKQSQAEPVLLPQWITNGVRSRRSIRSDIADFLLDGPSDE